MEQKNKAPAEGEGRDGFVLYRSTCEAVEDLPKEQRAEALSIIYKFALDGTPPPDTKDPLLRMFIKLSMPTYQSQRSKYLAGKKGGEAKGEIKARTGNQNARKKPAEDTETYTSEQKEEYRKFMEWGKGTSPFYFDGENCPPLALDQYFELRQKYTKEEIFNGVRDLEGKRKYQENHTYKNTFAALTSFLRQSRKTK